MGRLGCLVLIIVVLVVGYDQWRITQMRNEISAISAKVGVSAEDDAEETSDKPNLVTALAKAEQHAKNAKDLLEEKKTAEAQEELEKALESLQSANTVSKDIVGGSAEFLGQAKENAVKMFQKAWSDISEEAKPKKSD